MAWNEPGGNSNNQDPWGGRRGGDRKGPPDLDEAFRKLQDSLNGLFGSGKKRGGGDDGGGRSGGFGLLGIGLALLAVVWLYSAVYVVDEQGLARIRPVTTAHTAAGRWVVDSGIAAGDRVIVEGLPKVRPNAPVKVAEAPAAPATQP